MTAANKYPCRPRGTGEMRISDREEGERGGKVRRQGRTGDTGEGGNMFIAEECVQVECDMPVAEVTVMSCINS